MRIATLFVFVAFATCGEETKKKKTASPVKLAVVAVPGGARVPPVGEQLTLHLTKDGRVWFDPAESAFGDATLLATRDVKPGLRAYTLDDLGLELGITAELYELQQRRKGGTGFIKCKDGGRASRVAVLLHVDEAAPMRHLQWLLTILAEYKYYRIWFATATPEGSTAHVRAYLPSSLGFEVVGESPRGFLVRISPSKGGVTYRHGTRTARALDDVADWIRAEAAADKDPLVPGIRTHHQVPFGAWLRLVATFHRAGHHRIGYYRFGAIPTREQRKLVAMPAPTGDESFDDDEELWVPATDK